jgi:XisI protein
MDKLSEYRKAIQKLLTEYDCFYTTSSMEDHENCLVFDEHRDQYLWIHMGWQGKQRCKGITIHVRIKNEKIWIEEDWTEEGVATELINSGIPSEDIVLAFYPPEERYLTDFAVS